MFTITHITDVLDKNGIEYEIVGNRNFLFDSYSSLSDVKSNTISWLKSWNKLDLNDFNCVTDVILFTPPKVEITNDKLTFISTTSPKAAFFLCVESLFVEKKKPCISTFSNVRTLKLGKDVSIGDFCSICEDVVIGDNVVIENNVSIVCPTVIGDNVHISSGVVIGTDGFGYYYDQYDMYKHVPHTGGVVIENDVEIGANVCIDRGTIGNTLIRNNVKIDNLCHIGHNVIIENNSLIIAGTILCGSCKIEENSYIAPGAIIINQGIVGKDSLVGMGAVVTKDVPENKVVAGVPAKILRDNK